MIIFRFRIQGEKMVLSILMINVVCFHFSKQDVLEHMNVKCRLCAL